MKTIKELIAECDVNELTEHFIRICNDIPDEKHEIAVDRIERLIDELISSEQEKNEDEIIIPYIAHRNSDDRDQPDTSMYSINDIRTYFRRLPYYDEFDDVANEDISDDDIERLWEKQNEIIGECNEEHPENNFPGCFWGKAYEFTDRIRILGCFVPEFASTPENAAVTAAAILYEMTFFGWEEDDMKEERQKLDESIAEIREIRALPEEEQEEFISIEELENDIGWLNEDQVFDERSLIRSVILSQLSLYRSLRSTFSELEQYNNCIYDSL